MTGNKKGVKHTPLGYFKYFYNILGGNFIIGMVFNFGVSFLDGIGLAMFIPLLQFISSDGASQANGMGGLGFVIKGFQSVGIPVNLISVLALMVIIFVIKGICSFYQGVYQIDLIQRFSLRMRMDQITGLDQLSYSGFLSIDAGTIQNTVNNEVNKMMSAVRAYIGSVKTAVMLLTYVALAFIANWQFSLFVGIGAFLSNLVFKKVIARVKSNSISLSYLGHRFNSYISQMLYSFKYLKATNKVEYFSEKLIATVDESQRLNREIGVSQSITNSLREPLVILIIAIVMVAQVELLGNSLGSIILSLLLFYRALNGLMGLQSTWQSFTQNVGSIQVVDELSQLMKNEKEQIRELPFTGLKDVIEFKKVNFYYGINQILFNVSLSIPKKNTIAFVGESGSGKTTLANLLTGLIQPVDGEILLDGVGLFDYNLRAYREKIGYISQEPVIFTDNIYNNVTFGAEKNPENLKHFWDVLDEVYLGDLVQNLPEKENTLLGDNGMLISGGQKQRISIARELYKNSEILILDEATSALDSETENFIQQSLDRLQGRYTMLVIAHRLSTIKHADIIYYLDKGRVIEQGSFDELVSMSKGFARLVSLQQLAN